MITATRGIRITENKLTLTIGDNYNLVSEVYPKFARNSKYTYESSDESVVMADGYTLSALSVGEAVITVYQGDKAYDVCSVTVVDLQPVSVSFPEKTMTSYIGRDITLGVDFIPENATDTHVVYESSDNSIAYIMGYELKSLRAGTVTLKAKHIFTGLTCETTLEVLPVLPESIKINIPSEMYSGDKEYGKIIFEPSDVTDTSVIWESSDPMVVYVVNGEITASKVGTAVLKAKHSTGVVDEITVTVKPVMPKSVTLSSADGDEFLVGDVVALEARILPVNTTDKTVIWKSSDDSMATVDENGKVTFIKAGDISVTATLCNGVSSKFDFKVSPKQVQQGNGFIKTPYGTRQAPVKINAPLNKSCYAYFKSSTNSNYDFSVYAAAGTTVDVKVPVGKYTFYYAAGDTWYGTEYKFWKNTVYYKSPNEMNFYISGNYVYGTELTLHSVINGNMETEMIDDEEFPG